MLIKIRTGDATRQHVVVVTTVYTAAVVSLHGHAFYAAALLVTQYCPISSWYCYSVR